MHHIQVCSRVGTAFPHLLLMWERVSTLFHTSNVIWRFRLH